jgi:hypothetical protein
MIQRLSPPIGRRGALSMEADDAALHDESHDSPRGDRGVLVLNHNYEPLNICAVRRGLVLMQLDKVEVLRFSENTLKSADDEFLVTSVLRLRDQV